MAAMALRGMRRDVSLPFRESIGNRHVICCSVNNRTDPADAADAPTAEHEDGSIGRSLGGGSIGNEQKDDHDEKMPDSAEQSAEIDGGNQSDRLDGRTGQEQEDENEDTLTTNGATHNGDDDAENRFKESVIDDELEDYDADTEVDTDGDVTWSDLFADWLCAPFDNVVHSISVGSNAPLDVENSPGFFAMSTSSPDGLPVLPVRALAVAIAALLAARLNRSVHQPGTEELASIVGRRARPSAVSEEQRQRAAEVAQRRREEAEAAEQARKEMESQEFKDAMQKEQERLQQQAEEERKRKEAEEEERQRRREEARQRMKEEKRRREERKRQEEEERLRREREAEEDRRRRQAELEAERQRKEQEFFDRGGRRVRANVRGHARKSGMQTVEIQAKTLGREIKQEERDIGESALRMASWKIALEVSQRYRDQIKRQSLAGSGPLVDTPMDEPLLNHLSRWLASRTASASTASSVRAARHGAEQDFNPSVEFAVLPDSDEESMQSQLQHAIEMAESSGASDAAELLAELAAKEGASVLSTCLVSAQLLERHDSEATRAAAELALIRRAVEEGDWRSFFLDSGGLKPGSNDAASAADMLFGEGSFVAIVLRRLCGEEAEEDPHSGAEEEFPDEAELRRMRRKQVEAKTPIPERVWALRNSSNSLAQSGALGQAAEQLQRAVKLKMDWLGEKIHPAVLGELRDLASVLQRGSRLDESDALRKQQLRICYEAALRLDRRGKREDAREVLKAVLVDVGSCSPSLGDVPSNGDNEAEKSLASTALELLRGLEGRQSDVDDDNDDLLDDMDADQAADVMEKLAQRFSPKIEMHRRAGEAGADEEW